MRSGSFLLLIQSILCCSAVAGIHTTLFLWLFFIISGITFELTSAMSACGWTLISVTRSCYYKEHRKKKFLFNLCMKSIFLLADKVKDYKFVKWSKYRYGNVLCSKSQTLFLSYIDKPVSVSFEIILQYTENWNSIIKLTISNLHVDGI